MSEPFHDGERCEPAGWRRKRHSTQMAYGAGTGHWIWASGETQFTSKGNGKGLLADTVGI
ncbi:protein of unknown function [Modestobacter italicus]|uniref:Uncharacterized protein n=1 Tax=Modestobacter italicus (strain DSM 44449 / CECT 9708 / BC 501) TaxID=2732864 RepID=I4EUL4_MODI5|nr:protein of unknown function [Modestobacter marinus]